MCVLSSSSMQTPLTTLRVNLVLPLQIIVSKGGFHVYHYVLTLVANLSLSVAIINLLYMYTAFQYNIYTLGDIKI